VRKLASLDLLTEEPDIEGLLDNSFYKEAMK
jgi:hypothetical protein